jgi:hypothetical protein
MFNLSIHKGELSASRFGRFTQEEIAPSIHCTGGWMNIGAGLNAMLRREKYFLLSGIELRSSSPEPSYYTD